MTTNHEGSRNGPDGRYTVRDDSLPHQIRLYQTPGGRMAVGCTCLERHTHDPRKRILDTLRFPISMNEAWDIYDHHLSGE